MAKTILTNCKFHVFLHLEQMNIDMASNPDFVQYIVDQCRDAGEIVARKMFGDYGFYCDGLIVGLISDNGFYLKPTEAGKNLINEVVMKPPYEGAKPYFYIEEVDDHDKLSSLVKATHDELASKPATKTKRKK